MTTEQLKRDLLVKAVHAFDDKYPMTAVQRMDLGLLIGDAVDKIIEQLSAQTAEPVAWMLEFDSDDENAVTVDPKVVEMWRTQHDNPYDVTPLYTHPAKTEQPSLSDALDIYEAQTKALPFGHEIRERGYSAYNWQAAVIRDIRALLSAQRQDSDKGSENIAFIGQCHPGCHAKPSASMGICHTMFCPVRDIANGAPK